MTAHADFGKELKRPFEVKDARFGPRIAGRRVHRP